MFSMFSRLALVATVAVTAACAEDLTAVNATVDAATAAWSKVIAEGKTAGADLATKGAALAVAETDATGKGLKGTFDTALADHGKVIEFVLRILEGKGIDHHLRRAVEQAVAVGLGAQDFARGDQAAATGPVLDDDRLAQLR